MLHRRGRYLCSSHIDLTHYFGIGNRTEAAQHLKVSESQIRLNSLVSGLNGASKQGLKILDGKPFPPGDFIDLTAVISNPSRSILNCSTSSDVTQMDSLGGRLSSSLKCSTHPWSFCSHLDMRWPLPSRSVVSGDCAFSEDKCTSLKRLSKSPMKAVVSIQCNFMPISLSVVLR